MRDVNGAYGHLGAGPARRRIEEVFRLTGDSTVRVTQDVYISADGDLFERVFIATEQGSDGA